MRASTVVLGATILILLFSSYCAAQTVYDAIVVGAGISGLAAAARLKAKGLNVIVLEARSRTGGRIWTVSTTVNGVNTPIDLGASWIHGVSTNNPLVGLASSAGAQLSSSVTNYDNSKLYNGIDGTAVPSTTETAYDNLYAEWEDYLWQQQNAYWNDPGLQTVVNSFIAKKGLAGANLKAFQYLIDVYIQHEYGGSTSDLSLWFDEDSEFNGGDKLVIGGYQKITNYVGTGVSVNLNHQVTKIDYSSSTNVVVTALNAGITKTFSGKRVIVTLPIGVLKAGSVVFNPALPATNQNAINAMGSGLLNKCVLVFNSTFWGSSVQFLERIAENGDGAWEETMSLVPATGKPILMAFNAASYAATLESQTDAQTVGQIMTALRKIWPTAPNPVQSFVTRWKSDPYSLGSYSYTTARMEYGPVHKGVANPVGNGRIRFAGEHTHLYYPATAHGAFMSGRDAACSVLQSLSKTC